MPPRRQAPASGVPETQEPVEETAAQTEPAPPEFTAEAPAAEPAPAAKYIATVRHFVGGAKGYIEPGDPIQPSAEDLPLMLAQNTIREV